MKHQVQSYIGLNAIYHFSLGVTSVILSIFLHENGFNYAQISLYSLVFWIFSLLLEIPSGFLADLFPTNIIVAISSFFRGCGIFFVVFSKQFGMGSLVIGGLLAAIGEALKSGTLEAWITDELLIEKKEDQLNFAFSRSASLSSLLSLISGYAGSKIYYMIDKNGPFILALLSFVLSGMISLFFVKDHKRKKNHLFEVNYMQEIKTLIQSVRANKLFLFYIFYLAPFLLISTAPFNQWNLAFENFDMGWISVSEIYICIKIFSIFGSYISDRVLRYVKKFNLFFVRCIYLDVMILFGIYILKNAAMQVFLFLIQVSLVSILEIIVLRMINTSIGSDKRTTFLSIQNSFDSILSIFVISLMGLIADHSSVLFCWLIFAFISCFWMFILERKRK